MDGFGTPHTKQLHLIERFHLIEDGKVLEANIHVEDRGAFTMPWDAIQRFRQYWAVARKVPIERLPALATPAEGPLIEAICAENPKSFFAGQPAMPIPQAAEPDLQPSSTGPPPGADPRRRRPRPRRRGSALPAKRPSEHSLVCSARVPG